MNNIENIDIQGITSNCEDEIGIIRNEDGFIWNKPDTIKIEKLQEVVINETIDDPIEVTNQVYNNLYNELSEYGYI